MVVGNKPLIQTTRGEGPFSMLERRLAAFAAMNGQVNEACCPLFAARSRQRHASSVQHIARMLPTLPWCLVRPALTRSTWFAQACATELHERGA